MEGTDIFKTIIATVIQFSVFIGGTIILLSNTFVQEFIKYRFGRRSETFKADKAKENLLFQMFNSEIIKARVIKLSELSKSVYDIKIMLEYYDFRDKSNKERLLNGTDSIWTCIANLDASVSYTFALLNENLKNCFMQYISCCKAMRATLTIMNNLEDDIERMEKDDTYLSFVNSEKKMEEYYERREYLSIVYAKQKININTLYDQIVSEITHLINPHSV